MRVQCEKCKDNTLTNALYIKLHGTMRSIGYLCYGCNIVAINENFRGYREWIIL